MTFGIHNHYFKQKFAYESPEDVLRALSGLSPTVGATADMGHFASCGHDTVDAVRKLGTRLKLVHLKDVEASGGEVNVLLGRGISRISEVMKELHRQTFAGLIAVEYEKEGDVDSDMRAERGICPQARPDEQGSLLRGAKDKNKCESSYSDAVFVPVG
jgi:sugar phosphate isomerase/epimerase